MSLDADVEAAWVDPLGLHSGWRSRRAHATPAVNSSAVVTRMTVIWPADVTAVVSAPRNRAVPAQDGALVLAAISRPDGGREAAWMFPLRRHARSEVNRASMRRFAVCGLGWLAYAVSVALLIIWRSFAAQFPTPISDAIYYAARLAMLAGLMIALWWMATKPPFDHRRTPC